MAPLTLDDLGWTTAWAEAFAKLQSPDLVPGRVALEHNHVYRVLTAEGERLAETAGRLKHEAGGRHALPTVGDWVALRPEPEGRRGLIRAVLPRTGWFSRKAAGRGTHEQIVAANVDTVFVVFGLDIPVKARSIERYLVLARHSNARPIIVLNKADATSDLEADAGDARAVAGDTPVLTVSAREGRGLEDLVRWLERRRTLALIGPSGAGKSTLVNRLVGREVLPTGEVRDWDARGRHTSVHRQLVVAEGGGLLIDTPGMRELQLWEPDESIDETFADIAALADGCRFRDCQHDREPGCAVKAAVEADTIDAARYENYVKLQQERLAFNRKQEERARLDARRTARRK